MTHLFTRRQGLQGGLALLMPSAAWAQSTGAPTVTDGSWTDSARSRSLPWRLRLPAGAGPWPLVLFSHGLGGSVDAGTVWGQAWAAAGVAVLHLQHPGSDTAVVRAGLQAWKAAGNAEQWRARVEDVHFVLDELGRRAASGGAPWAQLRKDAIGLAGHSFGALTTQAVAGQRFQVPAQAEDPRPRAFIAFSPSPPRAGRPPLAQAFGGITRPFLAVTGSEDGDPFGGADTGDHRATVYEGLPPGQRALLWLDGADHATFGGQPLARHLARGPLRRRGPAAEREAQHHALVARITSDWWRATLLGDAAARASLAQPQGLGDKDRWQMA